MDDRMISGEGSGAPDETLREDMRKLLPDPEEIENIKYKTGDSCACRLWEFTFPQAKARGDCISYRARYVRGSNQLDRQTEIVFAASHHPFIERFSGDPARCAGKMARFFSYRPMYYELFRDMLFVSFGSGYVESGFLETRDCVGYRQSYSESYHDGGGSGSDTWFLWPAKAEIGANELFGDSVVNHANVPNTKGIKVPECKGYWFEGERLFVVDPWDIPGVFEFYYAVSEQYDWDSETENWSIGVRP